MANWDNGALQTLSKGGTLTCSTLAKGQLYALVFYNSTNADRDVNVTVIWGNGQKPVDVIVPGTTGNKGLASVLFVSGDDTKTVAASIIDEGTVQCYIASVSMPTSTASINNVELPADGRAHSFNKFTRYYSVPESHWYKVRVSSNINQFIFIQFKEKAAEVVVLNSTVDPAANIQAVGVAANQYVVKCVEFQDYAWSLQGNGRQMVFINADSVQNSALANITLQSLSQLYDDFNKANK